MRCHIGRLLANRRDYRQELKDVANRYRYVVFYGCGMILSGIVDQWHRHVGRRIDYCCDSDPNKWGKTYFGVECISPGELMAIKDECAVFVTVGDFGPVCRFLRESGVPSVNLLFKYDLPAAAFLAPLDEGDVLTRLCDAYRLLGDRQSERVFEAIVTRVLGDGSNAEIMLDVCEGDQYFPAGIVELTEHETFVDVGAFDGDTVRDLVRRTNGRLDRIFAFEIDSANYESLTANVRRMPEGSLVTAFNVGIWDSECDVEYSVGESNSTVGSGEGRGHVVPLDVVLEGEKPTFIKMDIEGAELNALRGAKKLIYEQRPTLAICVYHKFSHLWEIPLYVKSLVPEYTIYLRHHNSMEYETVCYAVA